MAERIVVDPVTRVEGHLRIEVDVDNERKVSHSLSSGTSVRGIELIVKERDPRDVWAYIQRICGVCTTVHAMAAVRSVEDALQIEIPYAGHLVRNLIYGTQMLHDHIVHFYHLHALDWVDVISAAEADPLETAKLAQSLSDWPNSSPEYFQGVKEKINKLIASGQLGIFANGYWGHPAYKLPSEVNLMAVAHYLEALEWQKEIVKVHAFLAGKNPHGHFLVGGMATPLGTTQDYAINEEILLQIKDYINKAYQFVNEVYVADLLAIASYYPETLTYGGSIGNFLCFGDYSPTNHNDVASYRFPRGVILNGDLNTLHPIDFDDPNELQEFIDRAWYSYDGNNTGGKHPYDGETTFNYTIAKGPYDTLNGEEKYSWIKSPRWKGEPMELGPLARIVVGYASGKEAFTTLVDETLAKLNISFEDLYSVYGRTLARGLEAKLIVSWLKEDIDSLLEAVRKGDTKTFNKEKWEPGTWPASSRGVGTLEAPRGALSHWIVIEDELTKNYQAVVPTTWNAAPKLNECNKLAPYEAALIGTPVADNDRPLEVIRVVHSFDPCLACAVHLTDVTGSRQTNIQVH